MTLADLHLGVRALVRGAGLSTFRLTVQVIEDHPNRVTVMWSVWVSRESLGKDPFYFKTENPGLIASALRAALGEPPRPISLDELVAVGAIPEQSDR